MTSDLRRPERLVLFYASGSPKSEDVLLSLNSALSFVEDDRGSVAKMDVAYHRAACVGLAVHQCPTVVILDQYGEELLREEDASKMTGNWFADRIDIIQSYEEWHEASL